MALNYDLENTGEQVQEAINAVFTVIPAQLNMKVEKNPPIAAGTKTKITYDSKGLVVSGDILSVIDLPTEIPASNIADGSVNNQEFQALEGVAGSIQEQLNIISNEFDVTSGHDHDGVNSRLIPQLENHLTNYENPHQTTKTQVGLGNCDNTSDVNKPISTATQDALDLKANKNIQVSVGAGLSGGGDLSKDIIISMDNGAVGNDQLASGIDATKISLGLVDNAEFNTLNGVTENLQVQLNKKINNSEKGVASGVATLDINTLIPSTQLPVASQSNLGAIKPGEGLQMNGEFLDVVQETQLAVTSYPTETLSNVQIPGSSPARYYYERAIDSSDPRYVETETVKTNTVNTTDWMPISETIADKDNWDGLYTNITFNSVTNGYVSTDSPVVELKAVYSILNISTGEITNVAETAPYVITNTSSTVTSEMAIAPSFTVDSTTQRFIVVTYARLKTAGTNNLSYILGGLTPSYITMGIPSAAYKLRYLEGRFENDLIGMNTVVGLNPKIAQIDSKLLNIGDVGTKKVDESNINDGYSLVYNSALDKVVYAEKGSGGTFDYNDLTNKPRINSSNTASLTPNNNETINGLVSLHKISKTGSYNDLSEKPIIVSDVTNEILYDNYTTPGVYLFYYHSGYGEDRKMTELLTVSIDRGGSSILQNVIYFNGMKTRSYWMQSGWEEWSYIQSTPKASAGITGTVKADANGGIIQNNNTLRSTGMSPIFNLARSGKDSNGIFTVLTWTDNYSNIIKKSTLSGGTSPLYTTQTIVNYEYTSNTSTASSFTEVKNLFYDANGDLISAKGALG